MDTGDRYNDKVSPVTGVALSPSGDRLMWANQRGEVKLVTRTKEPQRQEFDCNGKVNALAVSPDGKYVAVGVNDYTVKVWDVDAGKMRFELVGHGAPVNGVAFSPDGKLLASVAGDEFSPTARPGEVKLWDMNTGKERLMAPYRLTLPELTVAFSADGMTIATGGMDQSVRLWDVATGAEETALLGHKANVTSVVFSPDGRFLYSASADGIIKTWESLKREVPKK
jgi:WD40 repeat protein